MSRSYFPIVPAWVPALVILSLPVACGDDSGDTESAGGSESMSDSDPASASESDATTGGSDSATSAGPTSGMSDSATTGTTIDDPLTITEPSTTDEGCVPGTEMCGEDCVDIMEDPEHCGACDSPCDDGQACDAGECVSPCDEGLTDCGGACINTDDDPEHCGACGNVCEFGESCIDGACIPDEVCDGVDNNMDGEIDEGFPDSDLDGLADCVDLECALDMVVPGMVEIDESCVTPDVEVIDPWNVAIEWQWQPPGTNGSYGAPLVGQLTDDNNDGVTDETDSPDVVVGLNSGTMHALNGADGTEHWSHSATHTGGAMVLGDVDADKRTDVVVVDNLRRAVALDGETGAVKWTSVVAGAGSYPQVAVADVDADGMPEVLLAQHLLNGEDGTLQRTFPTANGIPYWSPTAADLDQDDVQEIIIGNQVFAPDGTLLWTGNVTGNYGHWVAIVDADDDPEAEVVMIGGSTLSVFNHDGTQIFSETNVAMSRPGPPCAADFDGDGQTELGWGSQGTFHMRELDGTPLWSVAQINDSSGLAGCSGYDINGDGAYEVLFADQDTMWIFDGATGSVNFSQPGHSSGTVFEYPTVADVDSDGSAEILFTSNYYQQGWGALTVMGHNGDGWQKSGATWSTHDFSVTNVLSNGEIPAKPDPWWQVYNVYRARPTSDDAAVDLRVEIVDVCTPACLDDSVVSVAVQVFNYGAVDSLPDVPVTLYRKDGDMYEAIETQLVSGAVLGGTGTDGLVFSLPLSSIGVDGLVVRVDDDGMMMPVQTECAEDNNEAAWNEMLCGG